MRRFLRGIRMPWLVLGVSVALAAASVALGISGGADLFIAFSIAALGVVFAGTGALVASRAPGNWIGWIFCAMGLLFEFGILGEVYVAYGSLADGFLPGRAWVGWISQWSNNAFAPTMIILSFLLFPTGRLPSARWRPVALIATGVAVVHAASAALTPGPLQDYGIQNPAGIEAATALRMIAEVSVLILVLPLMLLSVVSLFARLRRSSGIERQQLKWFAYAAALLATDLLASNALAVLLGGTGNEVAEFIPFLTFVITLSGIPMAMGVAILKHRLYDIDAIISRTLVYGALTFTLVLVYVGCVFSLQYVLRTMTGGNSQLVIVASTLAIAALFNPLRRRIQSFIDRRFYREKYDARKTLEAFSARLRDETDLDDLGGDLVSVVRETVQPAHASLWLRETDLNEKLKSDS